ncbi:4-hydroxy-tetrahydrodipicolinate synthase [Glaciimonas sp. PCH181]|uniref:4-hydroxy-tetrahydrodipicolinate synthase n=1 Tax=Glaciimonas sp. PCH181 TaxID=2133943 RepID=UPI000D3A4297|nr:4-hydroxy-tetrahydrodipicolinate synthase [Glaciimonas sp. PCH181]PUA17161.1 4-hydroxy-tetrahydrodipicolinate synthase [Glaciimonas sp. PCH181]
MSIFKGIWVPLITPFTRSSEQQLDLPAAQRLAVQMVDAGVHGLVVGGTTGEAAALSEDEQATLLAAIIEAVDGRCPITMGIGGSDTRALAARVKRLDAYELSGYLVSAPAYVRPSQVGILRHFQAIANETLRPIIIYNIPARTGVNISLRTIEALAQHPQFAAVKESSGDVLQLTELIENTKLQVFCGDDTLMLTTFLLGGHGAISAAAHIRPDLFVQLYTLMETGEVTQARAIFDHLLPLIRILFSEPNPGPVKAALAMQNLIREELRLPMTVMSSSGRRRLDIALERVMQLPAYPPRPAYPALVSEGFMGTMGEKQPVERKMASA